jgi:formylglycine-generating enzyme required for sulfatase activity
MLRLLPVFALTVAACLAKDSGRPVGDPCSGDGQCRSGLHCQYGRCRQPCTYDRDCGLGEACVPSLADPSLYVCTLPEEGRGSGCPDGLRDNELGVCRRPCDPDGPDPGAPCGPAQTCDQGWCRPVDVADGGVPGVGDGSLDSGGDGGPPRSLQWIPIPGGTFDMGSTSGNSDEQPVHSVTVASFEMLQTEVTVAQYTECFAVGACTEPSTGSGWSNWGPSGRYENHPVNWLTWHQAVDFCRWAGGRLPSEAEWEYAARSAGQNIVYPWGDDLATCANTVMLGDEGRRGCGTDRDWPVCSKPDGNTAQGLCDMAGNAPEQVQDWYHATYDGAPADGTAWEFPGGTERVVRGGNYASPPESVRAAVRWKAPMNAMGFTSFRCVRQAP